MKHLKLFKTQAEFDVTTLELPNVSYVEETGSVFCKPFIDYSIQYLTIEALEDDLDIIFNSYNYEGNTLDYRVDNGDWLMLEPNQNSEIIKQGQKIQVKGLCKNIIPSSGPPPVIGLFTISKKCNVSGNIMSLLYGDDFINQNEIPDNITFNSYFLNCTTIINSNNLILPATTLKDHCYSSMFNGCTSLVNAPELLATTLAYYCYSNMFGGCTSLTTAPELPATTLAYGCYGSMFDGCTSLTTAPELPATTLVSSCYQYMFRDCTSLTTAPELSTTVLISDYAYCYQYMFYGCSKLNYIKMLASNIQSGPPFFYNWVYGVSSTGTFVKHPDMVSLPSGTSGIPEGWTVVDYQ